MAGGESTQHFLFVPKKCINQHEKKAFLQKVIKRQIVADTFSEEYIFF
jgi:hypothetical protein